MSYIHYLYALFMASVDGLVMPLLKAKHLGMLKGIWMFPLSMLVYSIQPLIFYSALSLESMTVMNVLWDVMSDVIVTIIGFVVFGEILSTKQYIGIVVSLIGITLLGLH
jgi:drug/metabolite transporter (DMT)-like permease